MPRRSTSASSRSRPRPLPAKAARLRPRRRRKAKSAAAAAVAASADAVLDGLQQPAGAPGDAARRRQAHASRSCSASTLPRWPGPARAPRAASRRRPPSTGHSPYAGASGDLSGTSPPATAGRACSQAESQIGKPYQWGGRRPGHLRLLGSRDVGLRARSASTWTTGPATSGTKAPTSARAQLRPGDLRLLRLQHVGSVDHPSCGHVRRQRPDGRCALHRRRRPLSTQPSAPTTSARFAPTSGEPTRISGRGHLRRPQQRTRDLLRDGRQRARRP